MKYYGKGGAVGVNDPLDTITTKGRFALAQPKEAGLHYRMLQPHELKLAQGFPSDYKLCGSKADQIKLIGNSVPPGLSRAVIKAILPLLRNQLT